MKELILPNHPVRFVNQVVDNLNLDPILAKKVSHAIEQIDKALEGKEVDKKVKQKLNYARKRWPEALDKYEKYEQQLGERSSLSRTDPGATFMRMLSSFQRHSLPRIQAYLEGLSFPHNSRIDNFSLH